MARYSKEGGGCPEPISAYTPEKEITIDHDQNEVDIKGTIDKYFDKPREGRMKPNVAGDIGEYGK